MSAAGGSAPAPALVAGGGGGAFLGQEQRLTVYPIRHPDIWAAYKRQLASFWTPEEIDFSKDREQWARLGDDERRFIKCVLAFFAASDTIVSLNLMNNFCEEVRALEAQIAYTYQAMIENVHAEVYSIMIDTYITDPGEKARVFAELGGMPSVALKRSWAQRWASDAAAPFAHRVAAFAVVEGVFFSGAFCAIYWIKQRGLLPGLTKSNEFIARDEGQHTDFACLLYSKLAPEARLSQADAHAMFQDAVAVEDAFINESIPCAMVGMNAALMTQYIQHVADQLLGKLGYEPLYGASNPFAFMELCGMGGRSNFFEERVSQYQRADVLAAAATAAAGEELYTDDF